MELILEALLTEALADSLVFYPVDATLTAAALQELELSLSGLGQADQFDVTVFNDAEYLIRSTIRPSPEGYILEVALVHADD